MNRFAPLLGLGLLAWLGCAHDRNIAGTSIPDTDQNRDLVQTIETYRQRLVERNVEGLLVLASPHYFEDSGTPQADDDYGYAGLRDVLTSRLSRLKAIRYEIEYRKVRYRGNTAEVEVFLNGSFELSSDSGDRYRRVADYARFMLERVPGPNGPRWLFLSGM
jgi:hypothetical protein